MGRVLCEMIESDLADLIVSTGAIMSHGLSEAIGGVHYKANPDVPDSQLRDGDITDHALDALEDLPEGPFFLAVGFLNPHLPFVAPKKYADLYDTHSA